MQLTPEDIQKQQFHIRFRGFDVEEVDKFLENVGENYLLLTREKQELEEKVAELERQLADFREREKTFQNAILSTQKVADEIEEKSRKEAEKRFKETQQEIEKIREEAYKEVASLEKQVDELKTTKSGIKKELREFLQSYLDLLEEEGDREPEQTGPSRLQAAFSTDRSDKPGSEFRGAADSSNTEESEDWVGKTESSLYEKIDLPDDLDLPGITERHRENSPDTGEEGIFGNQDPDHQEDEEQNDYPSLNDSMLLNLEDPIDYEPEPSVIIDEESSEDTKESGNRNR
ncbi:MAG: DivIVA domain-containing protein [Desulfurivibrionaceae bacterium]